MMETLLRELDPILGLLGHLDLKDAEKARKSLEQAFPDTSGIERICRENLAALCTREAGPTKFGRVAKERAGFSVDIVLSKGAGIRHTHPAGEVNLCFAYEGSPTFDGFRPGWVVFPPGSTHPADVANGTMLMLYFLPGGQIQWHRA